jgi:CRISPR-associated exonuclease Cas4
MKKHDWREEEWVLVSAVEHYSYCPRQCGLINIESVWEENQFTIRGRTTHCRTDQPLTRTERGILVERALPIWSDKHGLIGKADVVEFHGATPVPIEYKSGKTTDTLHAARQLCAQAICLEEMFDNVVNQGFLFSGESRKRTRIDFDHQLRRMTLEIVDAIRNLQASLTLPPPANDRRCPRCSIVDACLPGPVTQANIRCSDLFIPRAGSELP